MEPVLTVEVTLPDGTVARWAQEETDDRTVDRVLAAIESVIGKPDTIIP